MRLHCTTCGAVVTTEVPDGTVVRALLTCPECLEKQPDAGKLLSEVARLRERVAGRVPWEAFARHCRHMETRHDPPMCFHQHPGRVMRDDICDRSLCPYLKREQAEKEAGDAT